MAQGFRLPAYEFPRNAILDFSSINGAIDDYRRREQQGVENERQNKLLAFQEQRLGMDRDRLGMDQGRFGMEQQRFGADMAQRQLTDPLDVRARQAQIAQTQAGTVLTQAQTANLGATGARAAEMHEPQLELAKAHAATAKRDLDNPTLGTADLGPGHVRSFYDQRTGAQVNRLEGPPARPEIKLGYEQVNKLTEDGTKFDSVKQFEGSFKDGYAGYGVGGDLVLGATRRGIPMASQDAANWWQGYDRHKNIVRNELFGASLTAGEQAAFEKADITPNMSPEIIKKNLAEQRRILQEAARRKAAALIAGGANPEIISQAYGFDPRQPPPPPSGSAVRVTSPDEARKLPSGTAIILPDGSPGKVP